MLPVDFGQDSENLGSHHRLALFGVSLARAHVRGRCNGVAESILLQVCCLIFDTSDSILHQNFFPLYYGDSPRFASVYTHLYRLQETETTATGFAGSSTCQVLLLALIPHCFL